MSDYNFIYRKLVQGPNDVVGALAYGIYKEEKIAYIEAFKNESGTEPTEAELREFHRMTNVQQRIDAYRSQADVLLQEFLDDVLAAELLSKEDQLRAELLSTQIERLAQDLVLRSDSLNAAVAQRQSFWPGVRQNIVAGLATTLLTFGFVLAAWMWAEGPMNILQGAWNQLQGEKPASSPSKTIEPK